MILKFRTFRYWKNSWILFWLFIPIWIGWLLPSIWLSVVLNIHFVFIFIIGNQLLIILLSKFRYINTGVLKADETQISFKKKGKKTVIKLNSSVQFEIYYNYNNFYIENFGILGGLYRYSNLVFHYKADTEYLDRIIVDGQIIYIKIRSKKEAKRFELLIDLLYDQTNYIKVYNTIPKYHLKNQDEIWILKAKKLHNKV